MTVKGLVAVMFAGTGIREPVTTTSASAGAGVALGVADCAYTPPLQASVALAANKAPWTNVFMQCI